MRNFLNILMVVLTITLVFSSCKKDIPEQPIVFKTVDQYKYNILFGWNDLFLQLEKHAAGYRPGPAANAVGYIGLANYEACVSGMPEYASIANLYAGLNIPKVFPNHEYHWPTVINAVNYYLYSRLFPEVDNALFSIKTLADKNNKIFSEEVDPVIFSRSKNHGESVAATIWEWTKTDPITFDQYNDPFGDYSWEDKFKKDGDWIATVPGPGKGMFPFWGKGRTLAIKENLKLCKPFSAYASYSENPNSEFYAQALEVMAQNTPTLSYQSEWVGEFWSDDLLHLTFSPASRWLAIANQVYQNEDASLKTALIVNVKVGLALHDAAIGCWNSKYYYNLERPETYIKRVIDPSWEPNLDNPYNGEVGISPSFPAYPSGHSTFGAAAAEVLASEFGYNYGMTDNCHKDRSEFVGYPRAFTSFHEMALENAWSRVPLGVHFRMDCEEGMRYGTEIGRSVNNLPWKK